MTPTNESSNRNSHSDKSLFIPALCGLRWCILHRIIALIFCSKPYTPPSSSFLLLYVVLPVLPNRTLAPVSSLLHTTYVGCACGHAGICKNKNKAWKVKIKGQKKHLGRYTWVYVQEYSAAFAACHIFSVIFSGFLLRYSFVIYSIG